MQLQIGDPYGNHISRPSVDFDRTFVIGCKVDTRIDTPKIIPLHLGIEPAGKGCFCAIRQFEWLDRTDARLSTFDQPLDTRKHTTYMLCL
jgi:hypothetical protein